MIPGRAPRRIAPRVPTRRASAGRESTSSGRLPDDVQAEHARRLAVTPAVGAALWMFGLVMDLVVLPSAVGSAINPSAVAIEVAGVVVSLAMYMLVRVLRRQGRLNADIGLVYMVANAALVGLLNTWAHEPALDDRGRLSWITIVILVSSMLMPARPHRMLIAALLSASMDPLAVWLAHLQGLPGPSPLTTLALFLPNYACALVAAVPSQVLQRLGKRLRQAQEMGSYHLVERLGRGGMGEVWRAEHEFLARSAAIKLVRPELLGAGDDAEARTMLRRFEREAQATASLSSPHTIQVFDFGVTSDRSFYYVMELLTGRDLDTLVREFGPLPADRVLYLLRQACHSLAEAHSRGIVHRDVTPANMYLCRMGLDYDFVKVLDFGLVKFRDQQAAHQTLMTGTHSTTGTPAFMAPEIALAETDVDQRADVYALGCVAYYLLTGQLVFDADTPIRMFVQHLQTEPLPPSERTEMPIPAEVDALVMACLEKDPNRRPQDAGELLALIDSLSTRHTWTSTKARRWWETHLVELTTPLASDLTPDASSPALAGLNAV